MATAAQIIQIAHVAHEANRAYCATLGDNSQVPFDEAREDIQKSAIDGVTAINAGVVTKPEDSHKNWSKTKLADGWEYGEVKDLDLKTHPCLVAFADLPRDQQAKDHLFFGVVTSLLRALA